MTISTLTPEASQSQHRSLLPGLAVAALNSTVLLILVGSIVRVTGHGLGCPDWPLCYGQAIPPGYTGAWVEFTHRVVGAITSGLILLVGILAWRQHRGQRWILRPAVAAVILLAIQIPLGGLHVIMEIPPETGLIHTGVAMLIVGLIAVIFASTHRMGERLQRAASRDLVRGRIYHWITATTVLTYLLLLTGAYVTRSGASLACPSFPLCGSASQALRRLIDIQMLHRFTAFAVAGMAALVIAAMLRRTQNIAFRRFAYGLGGLLLVQFGLGIANVLLRLPMWSRALHLTVAATIWAGMAVLWAVASRARRLSLADTEPVP